MNQNNTTPTQNTTQNHTSSSPPSLVITPTEGDPDNNNNNNNPQNNNIIYNNPQYKNNNSNNSTNNTDPFFKKPEKLLRKRSTSLIYVNVLRKQVNPKLDPTQFSPHLPHAPNHKLTPGNGPQQPNGNTAPSPQTTQTSTTSTSKISPQNPLHHLWAGTTNSPQSNSPSSTAAGGRNKERRIYSLDSNSKLLIVMVGLPARGKSYTSKKLEAYLNWMGYKTKTFNYDERRTPTPVKNHDKRVYLMPDPLNNPGRSQTPLPSSSIKPSSTTIAEDQHKIHEILIHQFLEYFKMGGDIAIYIPWATTNKKRLYISSKCQLSNLHIEVLFIENICDDMTILKQNLNNKISNTTYLKNMSQNDAATYLQGRIYNYYRAYESISDDNLSYIKIINLRSKIISNKIFTRLSTTVMNYLMSLHLGLRPIWLISLLKLGEKEEKKENNNNGNGYRGGENGVCGEMDYSEPFIQALNQFIEKRIPTKLDDLIVFYSPTATPTGQKINPNRGKKISTNILDHLNKGLISHLSLSDFELKYPDYYKKWKTDAFNFRYPNGESYSDLVNRLDPFVLQLERYSNPVMILADETIIRTLYCYFVRWKEVLTAPFIEIPKYTVIELASTTNGWTEKPFRLMK